MKLQPRTLSMNNVVSYTLDLHEGDELLDIVDGTAAYFREVLVHNGYYTTGPMVFRGLPGSETFTLMTTLGNRVNMVGDRHCGFEFHERLELETDYFYRHWDVEEPLPYHAIEEAVAVGGSRLQSVYHVILDFYGESVLDLYAHVEKR
ncbi:hypothetical protein ABIC47_000697 [Leifsonia sp. 563]